MKKTYKIIFSISMLLAVALVHTACDEEDEAVNGGEPMIRYIRVTNPNSSDSLLAAAYQNGNVAIIGENLAGVQEVWFNDRRASLSSSYITDKAVITTVPGRIPEVVTDKLYMVFADGDTLAHDFKVEISEPLIEKMKSEFVPDGEVATIKGNFFYEPLTVTFTGGLVAEIVSVEDEVLEVEVPAGAEVGPITITTNFGETESDFWFRDNRNVFGSMETTTEGWWHGAQFIVSDDPVIPNVDGKFMRVNQDLGNGAWFEFFVGPASGDVGIGTRNIPDKAITNPEDYNLKFEINTLNPLTGANVRLYLGNDMPNQRIAGNYPWKPNVDTKGEWETMIISFDEIIGASGATVNANGYDISFWFWEGAPVMANFGVDNFRVVPKVID